MQGADLEHSIPISREDYDGVQAEARSFGSFRRFRGSSNVYNNSAPELLNRRIPLLKSRKASFESVTVD